MKRVLVLAYHFPPEPTAGGLRPSYLAKYLPEFGWEPTVVTKMIGPPALRSPRVRSSERRSSHKGGLAPLVRRVKDLARSIVFFPDRSIGWVPGATLRALQITGKESFDAVISTSPPPTTHLVAGVVSMFRRLPWVADYRDLWSDNPYSGAGPIRSWFDRTLERLFLKHADARTAVSRRLLEQQHRVSKSASSETIPSAYDPAEWESIEAPRPASFDLCFAGTIYEGRRRLDLLFSAVAKLRNAGDPAGLAARFEIYGPDDALVRSMAESFGVDGIVTAHGRVARDETLRAQRNAAVLLVPLSMDPQTAGELGSKILEYVGAKRPVIAVGPPGSAVGEFIARHQLGWFASDEAGCVAAIRAAFARFSSGLHEPDALRIEEIPTARDVARRFAAVLDGVVEKRVRRAEARRCDDQTAASLAGLAGLSSTGSPFNFSE